MQATDLIVDVYEPEGGSDILISDFDAWTFFVLYIAQVSANYAAPPSSTGT